MYARAYHQAAGLTAIFLLAVLVSAGWERAERLEFAGVQQRTSADVPRIRIGDRVEEGWPMSQHGDTGGLLSPARDISASGNSKAVFFVTPTCPPCLSLLAALSRGKVTPAGIQSVVVVAGWSPVETMASYCRRHLARVGDHAVLVADDDARVTKRVLGPNPRLPSVVCVDGAGVVRGVLTGLSRETPALIRAALGEPLASSPIPVPSSFRQAEFIGQDGKRINGASLIAADLTVVVRVSRGCPGCGARMEDLALLSDNLRRRVVYVAPEGLSPEHPLLGPSISWVARNASAMRSVFTSDFVPQCIVFRHGRIIVREQEPWSEEEVTRFLSWCALQS